MAIYRRRSDSIILRYSVNLYINFDSVIIINHNDLILCTINVAINFETRLKDVYFESKWRRLEKQITKQPIGFQYSVTDDLLFV